MALEWLKEEVRALLPQGQSWLLAMRHELVRVQALHRRERARERLLQSELDNARSVLTGWQARRDMAMALPREELAQAAAAEVQRHAAEVEAIQSVLTKQVELTRTVSEKLTMMESRFFVASEQAAATRRPPLLIASTLSDLARHEQRFEQCERQLQRQLPRSASKASVAEADFTALAASQGTDTPVGTSAAAFADEVLPERARLVTTSPANDRAPDADFVTASSSVDKPEQTS